MSPLPFLFRESAASCSFRPLSYGTAGLFRSASGLISFFVRLHGTAAFLSGTASLYLEIVIVTPKVNPYTLHFEQGPAQV
jgi:hypothetical protein